MSLHAQLSPEALARLHAQKRNSTISSLVIAFLVIVLIGLVLGLFLLPKIAKEEVVIVTYSYEQEKEKPEKKVPKETVQKKPSSPSASVARVITSAAVANVAIPVPDVEVTTPSLDFGESSDFGSGWGSGTGGNGFQSTGFIANGPAFAPSAIHFCNSPSCSGVRFTAPTPLSSGGMASSS